MLLPFAGPKRFSDPEGSQTTTPGKYRHLVWRLYEGGTDGLCMKNLMQSTGLAPPKIASGRQRALTSIFPGMP